MRDYWDAVVMILIICVTVIICTAINQTQESKRKAFELGYVQHIEQAIAVWQK